ncbi:hypothetical protein TNIN_477871 [Trichonephila inaurata madagascariensis]|uniref:Uncharacterized protein n=1 Tax=Trichonephila inaurata madagascariensis TaxID=2747483 RepID=A0A8X6XHR2_9ARAC|nr:hypothetical protein TNIN_477871 [Trichonephila inaurata madagascariensis]
MELGLLPHLAVSRGPRSRHYFILPDYSAPGNDSGILLYGSKCFDIFGLWLRRNPTILGRQFVQLHITNFKGATDPTIKIWLPLRCSWILVVPLNRKQALKDIISVRLMQFFDKVPEQPRGYLVELALWQD